MPVSSQAAAVAGRFAALTGELGLLYGGDYNPEQWEPQTWREDARLMREAGVNLVTVGVFSWARYEPRPGERDFAWLDEVLDLLHAHGVGVDLATPTASPPAWLGLRHPETLPVDPDGVRLVAGSRNHFSPASRVYREHALAITTDLVERYADHPAVRMWHVGNEYGQVCYGDESAREFRRWLEARYGTIEALNAAWGTAFWSQHYADWDEILPPRRMPYHVNPTQSLDFRRYSSDLLRDLFREQRDVIRARDAMRPVTTNFMGFFPLVDYWSWASDLDVVADDAYPDPTDPYAPAHSALTQDLMRSLGGGRPWLLMEQAAGAVSWREHNVPKSPERSRLESLQAVARGSDGVCFFQWRAAKAGAERFHSAMLPHAGPDTRLHRGVRRLGADLRRLRPVVGTTVPARVAMLFDWESWWAAHELARPTVRLDTVAQLRAWYRPLWEAGIAVDVVRPGSKLARYDVVLVPQTYLLDEQSADRLTEAAQRGASVVVGPFTGVADDNAQIRAGRFPVLLTGLLGVSGEEWVPLPDGGVDLMLDPRWASDVTDARATTFAEALRADDAEVLATFGGGHLDGLPAITRATSGQGRCWYVGTLPSAPVLAHVLDDALREGGVQPEVAAARGLPGLEVVRRGPALFLLNHSDADLDVPLDDSTDVAGTRPATDLLTGTRVPDGKVRVPAVGAVVLVQDG